MNSSRYVLLDRDGVINQDSDNFIKSAEEWQPIPGSLEAIALLNEHNFRVAVISNQSGLARGLFDLEALNKIHEKMCLLTKEKGGFIEAIYYCPHGPDSNCNCRKPKPGLLQQFSVEKSVSLENLPFIGDKLQDIQAGLAVAAKPILVKTGKGQMTLKNNPKINLPIFENLYVAAEYIISGK